MAKVNLKISGGTEMYFWRNIKVKCDCASKCSHGTCGLQPSVCSALLLGIRTKQSSLGLFKHGVLEISSILL